MPNYAILVNNRVENIISADSIQEASMFGNAIEIVPGKFVHFGAVYDESSDTFTLESVEENANI